MSINVKVGSAPDNWGVWFASDPKQIPWERFLQEAAVAGYPWIELGPPGYLPPDPAVLASSSQKTSPHGDHRICDASPGRSDALGNH